MRLRDLLFGSKKSKTKKGQSMSVINGAASVGLAVSVVGFGVSSGAIVYNTGHGVTPPVAENAVAAGTFFFTGVTSTSVLAINFIRSKD